MGIKIVFKKPGVPAPVPATVEVKKEESKKVAASVPAVTGPSKKPKGEPTLEDMAELERKMKETARLLSQKKGIIVDPDVEDKPGKVKDTTWANPIKAWAEKNKWRFSADEMIPEIRCDITPDENIAWRLCVIRSLGGVLYRVGLYFDNDSPAYPRCLEVNNLYKDDCIGALDYMIKGMGIFKYKGTTGK